MSILDFKTSMELFAHCLKHEHSCVNCEFYKECRKIFKKAFKKDKNGNSVGLTGQQQFEQLREMEFKKLRKKKLKKLLKL